MSTKTSSRSIRVLLTGARFPAISGSSMTMREMERALGQNDLIQLEVVDLSNVRGKGLVGIWRYAGILKKLFMSARRLDALFLFTIGSGLPWTLFPMWCIAVLTRTDLIVRCGGGTAHTHGGRLRRLFVRTLLRRTILYVVQTRMLCEDARSVGISPAVALPNGRDLSKAIRADHAYAGRWILLGRLLPSKGVLEAIEAFRRLPRLSLDLVGPADCTRLGEDRAVDFDQVELPSNVTWLGERDPGEVPALLAEYDGFVFPSYYSTEGHPGVLIEAMAAGLPIVTTRHRAIPEVVDDQCGILVAPRDVDGIIQAIGRIHEDSELRGRLEQASIERARSFDWARLSAECTELVISAVHESRR